MNGLVLLLCASAVFLVGYFVYSRFLSKVLGVDPSRPTPAHTRCDGCDYVPAPTMVLFGHHFATIAGAGPIVGPVLAAEFGWAAVTLWIVLGCVLIGAAHDMIALFLSVRHDGESIGSVIGTILGRPGKILFLVFSWSALVLVVAEFNRQIAGTFVADPAIATASLLFIFEAILFGLCVYRLKVPVLWASLVFVPLMFASVWVGNVFPLDIVKMFGIAPETAGTIWLVGLLVYCFVASTCPVWILLQPRDYLNAYLLYAMMALGFLGVFIAHPTLQTEAFAGFSAVGRSGGVDMLFPFLFVTVACGACSGFHALVASGTTAKQLSSEKSIRPIAYGGMLFEGVLAMIALIGVAGTYASQADYVAAVQAKEPVQIFASTIAGFCVKIFTAFGMDAKVGARVAESFMLLSVSAFLMTTVDSGTRLARFSWQELVASFRGDGADGKAAAAGPVYKVCHNMYAGTFLIVALVAALLLGNPKAAKQLWTIFASANQLLASLTLLAATLWFAKNRKPCWMTAVPMVFMLGVSSWALSAVLAKACRGGAWTLAAASAFLIAVAVALVCFAVNRFCGGASRSGAIVRREKRG